MHVKTMTAEKQYSISSTGSIRELGGKHLLLVYPENKPPYALDINESFARMFGWAQQRKVFRETDLARFLETEYALPPESAQEEARKTIRLWQENSLIQA